MPIAVNEYLKTLGLPEEVIKGLDAEKLSQKISTTDEFQSMTGRIGAAERAKQEAERRAKEWEEWGAKAVPMYEEMAKKVDTTGNGGGGGTGDGPKYITEEEVNSRLQSMAQNTDRVVTDIAKVVSRHISTYKEQPDIDAIRAIALDRSSPAYGNVQAAYEIYSTPHREAASKARKEADEKSVEERIAKAKEEAVMEFQSRQSVPGYVDTSTMGMSPIHNSAAASNGKTGVSDQQLLQTWNEAAKK